MSKNLHNTIRCAARDISESVLTMQEAQEVVKAAWRVLGDASYFHGFVNEDDSIASWERTLDEAILHEKMAGEALQEMQDSMLRLETAWVKFLTQA